MILDIGELQRLLERCPDDAELLDFTEPYRIAVLNAKHQRIAVIDATVRPAALYLRDRRGGSAG